jgi:hypothetical protein
MNFNVEYVNIHESIHIVGAQVACMYILIIKKTIREKTWEKKFSSQISIIIFFERFDKETGE